MCDYKKEYLNADLVDLKDKFVIIEVLYNLSVI